MRIAGGRRGQQRIGCRPRREIRDLSYERLCSSCRPTSAEREVELTPDRVWPPVQRPAADETGMGARVRPSGCLEEATPLLVEIEDATGHVVVGTGQAAPMIEQA